MKSHLVQDKSIEAIKRGIMKTKLVDTEMKVKIDKKNMNKCKNELCKIVRRGTIVRELFMDLCDEESNFWWKNENHKNSNKFKRALEIQKSTQTCDKILGVKISNEALEEHRALK